MKKARIAVLATLLSIPLLAETGEQSYITFDDGMTTVRQGYDGRELEARVNLPLFAGDELVSGRRGRTEVRLADGNIVAIDRGTTLRLTHLANSYGSSDEQTVAELREGSAIVQLIADNASPLRLDTGIASYVGLSEGIYSVSTDPRGRDEISVLDGALEVRTERETHRLRRGESATLDRDGLYAVHASMTGESGFERWYLQRAGRYTGNKSRYLDARLSYAEADLNDHGDWIYVGSYGWVWRPYVSTGWRPYYHGSWHYGRYGNPIWASYEPWGWVPYHYGSWTFVSSYGWVWLPGRAYSPAWVYWVYGPSYIGWSPVGWYGCFPAYRSYYNTPHYGLTAGIGFYGRVRLHNVDLSGWTFIDSNTFLSTRVDRAALTVDRIRERFGRDGAGAVFSSDPARFTKDDLSNPSTAVERIARRGVGGGTGKEGSGSLADLTPFFRRDPELSSDVREQIDRSNMSETVRRAVVTTPSNPFVGSDTSSPTSGRIVRRDGGTARDAATPDRDRATTPATPSSRVIGRTGGTDGTVNRGGIERGTTDAAPVRTPRAPSDEGSSQISRPRPSGGIIAPEVPRTREDAATPDRDSSSGSDWRGRVVRAAPPATTSPAPSAPAAAAPKRGDGDWRRGSTPSSEPSRATPDRSSIPRDVIDRIGGARMVPNRDSSPGRTDRSSASPAPRRDSSASRPSAPVRSAPSASPRSSAPAPRSTPSVSRGSAATRSAPAAKSSAPSSSKSDGASKGSTNIKRDN